MYQPASLPCPRPLGMAPRLIRLPKHRVLTALVTGRSALSFEELDLAADPYPFQAVEPKWNTVNKAQTCEVEDLPQLQTAHGDPEGLDPIGFDGLQPGSFDLVNPVEPNRAGGGKYELEKRS